VAVTARRRAFALLLLGLGAAAPLRAHELRPAYLELRERDGERFDVRFRVPARGDARLALEAVMPERCRTVSPLVRRLESGAFTERWSVVCPGGLAGAELRIDGLAASATDALLRVERADGGAQVARLTPAAATFTLAARPGGLDVARTYLRLGAQHIALGLDHLLFLLALLLVVEGRARLIATITAFTLAHSLTLAAATLGLLRAAQPPVEATIALSIAFLAREIARPRSPSPSLTTRAPWLVAFAFGLLHGFGFAGALREVGLPERSIPLALLFFNLGVEAGQLGFVALVLPLSVVRWPRALPAYAIGGLAAYWGIERVAAFWG
jgi:hydrogenase/urease accessory protein HupE